MRRPTTAVPYPDPSEAPANISNAEYERLRAEIAGLHFKVDQQEVQLAYLVDSRDFNLRLSEYLVPQLEGLLEFTAGEVSIIGSTKHVTFGNILVVINPFDGGMLDFSDLNHQVEPLSVSFGADQKLSTDARRLIQGFVSEVRKPVISSDFWDGTVRTSNLRPDDALDSLTGPVDVSPQRPTPNPRPRPRPRTAGAQDPSSAEYSGPDA